MDDEDLHAETDRRLVRLEMRAMEADKLLEELSDVLLEQRRTIDRLEAEMAALRRQMRGDEVRGDEVRGDEVRGDEVRGELT